MKINNRSTTEKSLSTIAETLKEMCRPRVFFDIVPGQTNPNLLDVILRNSGGSPAYHITCKFKDDLFYYEGTTLSDLLVFRNLPFLEQGQEIRFFFRDFPSVLKEQVAYGKKETIVNVEYSDTNESEEPKYSEKFTVNIERYRGLLSVQRRDINDAVKEIENIRRGFERLLRSGLLIKTLDDLQKERDEFERRLKNNKTDRQDVT
jgi:hypothetical protein